jgi:pimeloyl-ACP methyl ester carboxylesterase
MLSFIFVPFVRDTFACVCQRGFTPSHATLLLCYHPTHSLAMLRVCREKVEWGRDFAKGTYTAVEEFVELPGVGHCPQDERPDLVNPIILQWVQRHAATSPTNVL